MDEFMESFTEWREEAARWAMQLTQGFVESFLQWCEMVARWMILIMQGLPAFLGDALTIVAQDPPLIAIGLIIAVGTVVLAVVIGTQVLRRVGRNTPAEDDDEVDEEEDDSQPAVYDRYEA